MGDDSWIQLWRTQGNWPCLWKTSRRANRWRRVLQISSNASKLRLIGSGVSTIRLQMPWSPRVRLDSEIIWSWWFTAEFDLIPAFCFASGFELNKCFLMASIWNSTIWAEFQRCWAVVGSHHWHWNGCGLQVSRPPKLVEYQTGPILRVYDYPIVGIRLNVFLIVSCCKSLGDLRGNITGYPMILMDISSNHVAIWTIFKTFQLWSVIATASTNEFVREYGPLESTCETSTCLSHLSCILFDPIRTNWQVM